MYFLSGVANSESWTQVNGQWPLTLYTDSNRAQFGGYLDTVGTISSGSDMSVGGSMTVGTTLTAGSQITGATLRMGPFNKLVGLYWKMANYGDENLGFYQDRTESSGEIRQVLQGFIQNDGDGFARMNFTGQHRCFIKDLPFSNTKEYEGRIVCADQNTYISMSSKMKKRE
jgi:hypothetical protein